MKIFNWVHRRFHHHKYYEAATVTKTKSINAGREKLALLENAAMEATDVTAFGGWKEGILAIGTFGFHPAAAAAAALWKEFEHEKLCDVDDDDYAGGEQDEEEEEIEFPLVLKAACTNNKHGSFFPDQKDDHRHAAAGQYCDEISKPAAGEDDSTDDDDQKVKVVVAAANKKELRLLQEAGERVTLADLFLAEKKLITTDQEDQVKLVHYDDHTESNTKKHASNSYDDDDDDRIALISMKKKLITKDHAASRPINKINRMVRKMLKKKIHPHHVEINQKETTACFNPMRIPAAAAAAAGSLKNA